MRHLDMDKAKLTAANYKKTKLNIHTDLTASITKLNVLEEFETSAPVPRDGMNAYLDNSQRGQSRTFHMYEPSDSESSSCSTTSKPPATLEEVQLI